MNFWFRSSGTTDPLGPLSITEIRARIASGEMNNDFELLEATGQPLGTLTGSPDWRALDDVLSEFADSPRGPLSRLDSAHERLEALRRRTHYQGLRETIRVLAAIVIFILLIIALVSVVIGIEKENLGAVTNGVVLTLFGGFAVTVLKHVVLLLADISDRALEPDDPAGPRNRQDS